MSVKKTELQEAILSKNYSLVQQLLQKEMTVSELNKPLDQEGTTFLHYAVQQGTSTEIIKILIDYGANAQQYNKHHQLPFDLLPENERNPIINNLLCPLIPKGLTWLHERLQQLHFNIELEHLNKALVKTAKIALLAQNNDANAITIFNERLRVLAQIPAEELAEKMEEAKQNHLKKIDKIKSTMLTRWQILNEQVLANMQKKQFLEAVAEELKKYKQDMPKNMRALLDLPDFFIELENYEKNNLEIAMDSFSGAYNFTELELFFKTLSVSLRTTPAYDTWLILKLMSINHTIIIGYLASEASWIIIDNNNLPARYFYDTTHVAQQVAQAFATTNNLIFATTLLTTKKHIEATPPEEKLYASLKQWQLSPAFVTLHNITLQKAHLMDGNGGNWLHMAARIGEIKKMKELLKNGVNANIQTNDKNTPLHYAICLDNPDPAIQILLSAKQTDPNLTNALGRTPLYEAVLRRNLAAVQSLLKYKKVNPNFPCNNITPLQAAINKGFREISTELQKDRSSWFEMLFGGLNITD